MYIDTYKSLSPLRNKFNIALLLSIVIIFLILSTGSIGFAVEQSADIEKRHMIEKMYLNYQAKFSEVADIDSSMAAQLAMQKNVLFIDAREQNEQRVSMLPGAITAKTFLKNYEKYKDHTKIVYCTVGYRSGKFAQKLSKKGIQIYNLRGGILAWVHSGSKVHDQNGPTDRIHVFGPKWDLAPGDFKTIW